jgi:DNA-binding transcriptional ArsR family regulator
MVYHAAMAHATSQPTLIEEAALDRVFRALGDPTRRAIVAQLSHGEATMSQIAGQFDMSLPGVSKHVSVLEDAGLVHRWRSGRARRCRLDVERMQSAYRWIETQTSFWNESLDALADFLETGPDQQ